MHKILLLILLGTVSPIIASTPRARASTRRKNNFRRKKRQNNFQRKKRKKNITKDKRTWHQKAIENWKKVGIAILVALCCVAIAWRAFFQNSGEDGSHSIDQTDKGLNVHPDKEKKTLLFTVNTDDKINNKKFSFYSQTIIEDIKTNRGQLESLEKDTSLHFHINSKNPTAWIQAINRIHELHPTFKNSQNKQGDTPLHIALREGVQSDEIIKLFITNENKNIQNKQGNTPLHIALLKEGSNAIVKLLTTDENKYSANNNREQPYDIAVYQARNDQITRSLC